MRASDYPSGSSGGLPGRKIASHFNLWGCAALLALLGVEAAAANPIILNQPFTANPGDVVSIVGSGFGSAPQLFLKPGRQSAGAAVQTLRADNSTIVFQAPKGGAIDLYEIWVANGSASSPHVAINAPRAMQFDTPEIAPGGAFRIFGRNLYVGVQPSVTFVDAQTNASLPAAVALTGYTDSYRMQVTAPSGVVPGRTYRIVVSNGLASVTADQTILGRAPGVDHFGLGVPWGADFIYQNGPNWRGVTGQNEQDHHIVDVTTDPDLTVHAKGDGVTNNTPAIQAAIYLLAANGGGVVYLPAGTYKLDPLAGLALRSGVVLQGHSAADTKIVYGPSTPPSSPTNYYGVCWYDPNVVTLSGLADLSIQNVDLTSQNVVNGSLFGGTASKFFIQRVNWDLGSGKGLAFKGDRIVIENSTFHQAKNSQYPYADGDSGIGPMSFGPISNYIFRNNTVAWASGQNSLNDLTNAVIENNHFTRSASDQIVATAAQTSWPYVVKPIAVGDVIQRTQGRQLAINFGNYVVIHSNTFDVSDGTLKYNWNDGEAIQTEGGGPYPRGDAGAVTSATATTIADNSRCSGVCAWNYFPNSVVAVVSGAGAGQVRRITSRNNNTFTVDKPWDIIPAAGDHFAIDVPSLQNVLIRYNTIKNNPVGMSFYGSTLLNVSVIGNALTDNGGIYLRPDQVPPYYTWTQTPASFYFRKIRNIEINSNSLTNTSGLFPSYIVANFAMAAKTSIWGASVDNVEARNNSITARPGTYPYFFPEGYLNNVYYQQGSDFVDNGLNAINGTVFQNNNCVNCSVNYLLSTGVNDTIIWGARTSNSPGVASQFVQDYKIWRTATHGSTGTLIGP